MTSSSSSFDALVVGGVDYGEADRVVHLLTRTGRVEAFAPSARKSRRRFGGALQPFTTVRAEVGRRKAGSGLATLVSAEILRLRLGLAGDLERLALAGYAAELGFRLAPEGLPTELPGLVEGLLEALLVSPASRAARRAFELRVLAELGYRPCLDGCVVCDLPARFLDLERGGLLCDVHRGRAREIGPKTRAWLVACLVSGETPAPSDPLGPEEAERAARAVGPSVDLALDACLDRPPGALRLLREVGL